MFNTQLQRLQHVPVNSIEDVRTVLRELVLTFAAEQTVEHYGKARFKHSTRSATQSYGSENRNTPQENSAVIIDHYNDATNRTPGADTATNEAHGLWVRHGTAKFDNDVFFDTPPRVVFRGVTTAKWASGSPPTVAATESDVGLGAVTVRLASTTTQDPNIRSGETIVFGKAADGLYYAFDSHLDGKIGEVRMWKGLRANVPPGWRILDGTGGIYDMTGRTPQGLDNSSGANYTSTLGTTGGAATHTHTFTSANASPGTDVQGAHGHNLTISADGAHSHTGSTGSAAPGTDSQLGTGYTDYATASITVSSATTGASVGNQSTGISTNTDTFDGAGADLAVVSLTDPGHSHGFTDPGHSHSITEPNSGTGHRHAYSSLSHSHTVSSHNHTITASADHTHAGSTADAAAGHSHTVNAHGHTGTTDTGSSYAPFLRLAFIERYE